MRLVLIGIGVLALWTISEIGKEMLTFQDPFTWEEE